VLDQIATELSTPHRDFLLCRRVATWTCG